MNQSKRILALFTAAALCAPGAASTAAADGFLYTSLNGQGPNSVIAIERKDNGKLGKQIAYATGSLGGANIHAGGDARGDFDSQGAVQIVDNALLVVNAGGNTISVFDLNRRTGALKLNGNYGSGGVRPVSIAVTPVKGKHGQYWVVVGNQWNNPNSQKGGAGEGKLEQYPHAAFHQSGHKAVSDDRNIYLFQFDSRSKRLSPVGRLDAYVGTNGGPTTAAFNDAGDKLAVATWGIAHFGTANPTEQKPSRVYVYDFDAATGAADNRRFFEEDGIAGSIGISWAPKRDVIYASNFNLRKDKHDNSLTALVDDGRHVKKESRLATGDGPDIDEACWTLVSPNGKWLYLSSFGGNFFSVFDLDGDGMTMKRGNGPATEKFARQADTPPGDSKDMLMTSDHKHFYALGAYQTFRVAHYSVDGNGGLTLEKEYPVAAATEKGAGVYNFLGLASYER